jgi:hypothetical protein
VTIITDRFVDPSGQGVPGTASIDVVDAESHEDVGARAPGGQYVEPLRIHTTDGYWEADLTPSALVLGPDGRPTVYRLSVARGEVYFSVPNVAGPVAMATLV